MPTATLRQRFFPLHDADAVDRFLTAYPRAVVFKAGTSDKTFDAWLVAQRLLEPRVDVPVGFIRLPEDRAASDRIAVRTGVVHRSPQLLLFDRQHAVGHLDEFDIAPDKLVPFLAEHLPADLGPAVQNPEVVSLAPYRRLLAEYVDGQLPQERFEWAYLERLERDATWRDDETFARLDSLFENPMGRGLRPAALIAIEFQAQLDGRREPLKSRASRLLQRLRAGGDDEAVSHGANN